jgi:outer membrane protein TolC
MGEFKMGSDGTTTATGGLTMTLPIYAPAVYQNMKLTKEDILLAQEKARSSRLDLINQVTKAYYAALLSKDSRDVIKRSYNVAKENYDVVDKKFQVGKVSEYDKITAEVQMRSMSSSVTSAETGLNLALLRLKVLMGIKTDIDITLRDSLKAYEKNLTLAKAEVNESELSNNTSLRQLDMSKNMLERSNKLLKTNFLPTIGMQLQGSYTSYSNENWNVFNYKYSPSSTLALSVTVPIFQASNWTKLKSNRLQISQLADTRTNTMRQLSMAAQSYRQNMLTTISKLESDREAVRKADKAVTISAKRYDVGRGTILELNQSETALTQAELTYRQSIYDYLTNKADLDYTLGRE